MNLAENKVFRTKTIKKLKKNYKSLMKDIIWDLTKWQFFPTWYRDSMHSQSNPQKLRIDNPIISAYGQEKLPKVARVYWTWRIWIIDLMLTNSMIYKAIVIKTVSHWQKNRQKINETK